MQFGVEHRSLVLIAWVGAVLGGCAAELAPAGETVQDEPRIGEPAASFGLGAPEDTATEDLWRRRRPPADAGAVRLDAGPAVPGDAGVAAFGCGDPRVVEELALTNQARATQSLSALRCDERLLAVALAHSRDMCTRAFFAHENPDGLDPFERMRAAGIAFRYAGENIAYGYATPRAVHEGWMASSGHRANILSANYGAVGIGVFSCGTRLYWTQAFTN